MGMTIKSKSTISSIDIGKFIACFLIVILHCNVLEHFDSDWSQFAITNIFMRIAVPFFFVTSGYFLGKKMQSGADPKSIVINYCRRLLFPLVVFSIVNITEYVFVFLYKGDDLSQIMLKIFSSIIFYPFGALWFVQACIIGSLMLIPFYRSNKLGYAVFIGMILFLIALPFNSYYFIVDGTFLQSYVDDILEIIWSIRNGIFVGFVYLAIGSYIGIKQIQIKKSLVVSIVLLSGFLLSGEVYLVWNHWIPKDDTSLFISHLILTPALLLLLLQTPINISVPISITLRNLSVGIYYLHKPILLMVSVLSFNNLSTWLVTFSLAVGICLLFYRLNFETTNKLLK
ncbi:MAG: acyltransferase [Bacteroidales bacterium]|nr:acyltransferase [Bacteroidales bacterium]